MESFADRISDLRKKKGDPLRIVAAYLDIDQAILSKIEHGRRQASRDQVLRLAAYFDVPGNDLLISWLSDKLADELKDEELAFKALQVAEEKIAYLTYHPTDEITTIKRIKSYFKKHKLITKAWIFGSFARGEDNPKSDIDLLIEVPYGAGFSYFDLAEIQHDLEFLLKRKVDVGFSSSIRDDIKNRIQKDIRQIYEKSF